MKVLGIDASLGTFSAAVTQDGRDAAVVEVPGKAALEGGLRAISDVLEIAALAPHALDRIAVGVGPGTFTGVRIALSYAKSLALGWRLPLCAVSTFDALEAGLELPGGALLTVVSGRKGVISARIRTELNERRASGYITDVLKTLAPALSEPFVMTGNGAEDVRAALGERGTHVKILPRAVEPAALAIAALGSQRDCARSLHEVRADYGELPPAKLPVK